MAEAKSQAEPTMEEILASIRRIISEDDPEGEAPEAAAPAEVEAEAEAEPKPAPEPEAEPEPAPVEEPTNDNVLDLTQKLNDDGSVVDLAAEEPEPEPEKAAEPEPEVVAEPEPKAEDPESLLAPEAQEATTGALGDIVQAVASGRRANVRVGDGRTLEDIVREALTPELKTWLDTNLAPLVEQIVRDEVKKMVRRAEES